MDFEAIGTVWHIVPRLDEATQQAVRVRIEKFDKTYSRFRSDSWGVRVLSKKGTHEMPPDAYPLLSFYKKVFSTTYNKMTPLIGSMMEEIGYDRSYSLKPQKTIHQLPNFLDIVYFDQEKVTVDHPGLIFDFGAVGKGYLVDIVAKLLEERGVSSYLVNAGGDIYTKGDPVKIGLESPENAQKVVGTVVLQDEALAGSSPNRRSWEMYHHIMDPVSRRSTQDIHAVWVKANSCLEADGLATALFFADPQALQHEFTFEYAIMRETLEQSKAFNAEIFV